MKKALVTGATGFIGRQVLPLLLQRGFEVHAVSTKHMATYESNIFWHRTDLFDTREIENLFRLVAPSELLHLAWIATPGIYQKSLDNLRWVQASIEIARQFVICGGKRMVAAGSCAEYDWRQGVCHENRTPMTPQSLYGVCKLSLERILHAMAMETGLSFAWGRVFFPYGPHDQPQRLIPSVIQSLSRGEPARCTKGSQTRDYIFVTDVARAFVCALDGEITGPFNIASGNGVTVKEIVLKIGQIMGRSNLIELGAIVPAVEEADTVVGDIVSLTSQSSWRPEFDLEMGLRATIDWWNEQWAQATKKLTK